tara:strand:- start:238 stop:447 length:210 start_codon:yes stop_codon:yes gene_type:complete
MNYTNYPCQVEMVKYHLEGMKEGMHTKENMGFMNWNDACTWAGSVTQSHKVGYVVLEMRDLKTNELQKF